MTRSNSPTVLSFRKPSSNRLKWLCWNPISQTPCLLKQPVCRCAKPCFSRERCPQRAKRARTPEREKHGWKRPDCSLFPVARVRRTPSLGGYSRVSLLPVSTDSLPYEWGYANRCMTPFEIIQYVSIPLTHVSSDGIDAIWKSPMYRIDCCHHRNK